MITRFVNFVFWGHTKLHLECYYTITTILHVCRMMVHSKKKKKIYNLLLLKFSKIILIFFWGYMYINIINDYNLLV